ncbi:MAG: serine/threonine-protein kinase [Gemmatimonadales bacterium]
MTTDSFWARVRVTFEAGLDAGPERAQMALRDASGGDERVLAEAQAMLALEPNGFLDRGLELPADPDLFRPTLGPGTTIDRYRIVGLIGRGGMGEVYEAVRTGVDFERRVAIKVLRAGIVSPDLVRRFEQERRILAGLEHQNIAALTDGGILVDGRPYLVMEFVDGSRITSWCAERHLDVPGKLALFTQVCDAVGRAHRHLVVHRDIKPGNVMVTADGTVKLLDFGIAKVIDPDPDAGGAGEAPSRNGPLGLTPEYAAPEQLAGAAVTTATDIYALGLLLFELLTDQRPFADEANSLPELTRLVLTTDPPLPSSVARPDVARVLRGDLDAIVRKALRQDPADRYQGADRLVDDLHRHAAGLPVEAMRGHRGYRTAKFVGRHRGALAAAALLTVALLTGAASTWRESQRTRVQKSRAEATTRFLTEMLSSVDPAAAGKEVSMVEVLDSAAVRIRANTRLEPEVEASLQSAIGASYRALGKYDLAEPHLRRALALRLEHADDALATAWAHRELGELFDARGEYAAADSQYARGVALLPPRGDSAVEVVATDLLEQRARMQSLAGNLPAAESMLVEVVARLRRVRGDSSFSLGVALSQLGVTLAQAHHFDRAESVTREALTIFGQVLPSTHPEIGKALGRLATILEQSGRPTPADSAYRISLHNLDAAMGPSHPDVAWIRVNYAGFLFDNHAWDAAIAEADTVLANRGKGIPDTHPGVALAIQMRGMALSAKGDHAAAVRALRESLALRRVTFPAGHWAIGSSESVLGAELLITGARSEALQFLRDGCRTATKALGADHPTAKKAMERLLAAGEQRGTCA